MFKGSGSKLTAQTRVLAGLCLADLVSTIILLERFEASEANPLMAWFLGQGLLAFVAAKVALTVGPLVALEWVRSRRRELGRKALNTALAGYVLLYAFGVAKANMTTAAVEYARAAEYDASIRPMWDRYEALRARRLALRAAVPVSTAAPSTHSNPLCSDTTGETQPSR
jgi:hypothetical protein